MALPVKHIVLRELGDLKDLGDQTPNIFFPLFSNRQLPKKNYKFIYLYFFSSIRTASARTHQPIHEAGRRDTGEGEGQGGGKE
jgi:hypothetical protein